MSVLVGNPKDRFSHDEAHLSFCVYYFQMFAMRKSKFRHVYGQPLKKDHCYDNIRITKSSLESTFCSVNPKYVAIITEAAGGGAFLVLPISKVNAVVP